MSFLIKEEPRECAVQEGHTQLELWIFSLSMQGWISHFAFCYEEAELSAIPKNAACLISQRLNLRFVTLNPHQLLGN